MKLVSPRALCGASPALWTLVILSSIAWSHGLAGEPVASFTLRADWFDRGNVQVSLPGQSYADRFACIWNAGPLPNQAEYDLEFPVTTTYTLVALYTAADSRPVEIYLDGAKVHLGFAGVTGSWQTSHARWETQCQIPITQGKHTLKLLCPGPCMPHICALRLESPVAFPEGWTLVRKAVRPEPPRAEPPVPRAFRLLDFTLPHHGARPLQIEVLAHEEGAFVGPAAHNELLQSEAEAITSPWIAKLSVQGEGQAAQQDVLSLSPLRLRKMLAHTLELIDDFRTLEGVARDYLEAARREAAGLAAEVEGLLKEPDGKGKWERFARAYVRAYQLDHQVMSGNPLLDFDRLLLVRRSASSPALGLPQNWQSNCVLPRTGFDNEIGVLSPVRPGGTVTRLYRPEAPVFVGDVDLHFDARRMLFSSIGAHGRWQVFEIGADGGNLRQVTPGDQPDVDNYDACYLPDERILFSSTAFFAAVPCVNGSTRVANLYRMEPDGSNIRQLCFDQEHNWCPTLLPSGRVLYLRWEYTDTPHAHDRVLFSMNPDGTEQMEFYGSNSYWPNSLFYARPIPGQPARFIGIVGGHHGVPRMGELVLFDVSRGRREADGVVQRIPGRGRKVEPTIADNLVDASWPKFLHPYPLSDKYFLVASQPTADSLWGIYLVDVFDGMLRLCEEPGFAMLEPVPLRKTPRPPSIPDKIRPDSKEALVYLADVYAGGGLKGVPRGEVKRLRLFTYHFLFPGMGGPQGVVGMEGPWDIKRIMGTVPIEADGSALFRVPANTPISVQPLDADGKALQLMRSWFTAMPGEAVSCVGCHEGQNSGPPNRRTLATRRGPSPIEPWRGPLRGFNFAREVQPVLDKHCVSCHNGQPRAEGPPLADLRGTERIKDYTSQFHYGAHDAGHFTVSYSELHRWVRRPGLESDYHMLMPMEFHADTTQLVQMLRKGHYGVRLDTEAWDRLVTWIDLNAPFHGTWSEIAGKDRVQPLAARRRELLKRYAGIDDDPEAIPELPRPDVTPAVPEPEPAVVADGLACPGWPFAAVEARRRQSTAGAWQRSVDLGDGIKLDMARIPAGEFILGDLDGYADERPRTRVKIERPFWIGRFEVTNEQFARFDPLHDSRVESKNAMQFGVRGFFVNGPSQPVVRVSWRQAMAFCEWLSARTGERFTLPSEAQWEYACRAGTESAFGFGDLDADFSSHANLADLTLKEFVCHPYQKAREPFPNPNRYDDWIPKDERYRDNGFVSENVGGHAPNAWGLFDIHGNVWEWTRTAMRPYPYDEHDGRNDETSAENRVVRGGSWRDRPREARSAVRLAYRPYQGVFNVGFRVIAE